MKRLLVGLSLFVTLLLPSVTWAANQNPNDFVDGIDYQDVVPAQPTTAPDGKVEVVELFWYGCPHCFHFEQMLNKWLAHKPPEVDFVRIPAVFANGRWRLAAEVYYAEQVLGVTSRMHDLIFNAIHKQHMHLTTEAAYAKFFAAHGIPRQRFLAALHSFTVQQKVARAVHMTKAYGISGVPSIIVNGKYRTDGTMAGEFSTMLKVVDMLVARESAQMHPAADAKH